MAEPLPHDNCLAIDQVIEPCFGWHSFKQFIRGKTFWFIYKLWCLCSSACLLLKFRLYEGRVMGHDGYRTVGESVAKQLLCQKKAMAA